MSSIFSYSKRWQPTGFSGGGGTECTVISPHDPNRILLNSDMGCAFLSENGGHTWHMLPWQELCGCSFCYPVWHPKEPNVVYAQHGYTRQLRVSRDAGHTFSPIGRGLSGTLYHLAIDSEFPNVMLAMNSDNHVFRSMDGGESWKWCANVKTREPVHHSSQPQGLAFATPKGAKSTTAFICTTEAIYRSEDNGISWNRLTDALPCGRISAFDAVAVGDSSRLYIMIPPESNAPGLYSCHRSDDAGRSWRKTSDGPLDSRIAPFNGIRALFASPVNPDIIHVVRTPLDPRAAVFRSEDGGYNWRATFNNDVKSPERNTPDNHVSVVFTENRSWDACNAAHCASDPDILLVVDYSTQFITRDAGKTWKNLDVHHAPGQGKPAHGQRWINTGLNNTVSFNYDIDPFEPNRHYICATDIGFARSDDAGASWYWVREMGPGAYQIAIDPDVKGRLWGAFSQVHDIPNNNVVIGSHPTEGNGFVGRSDDHGITWYDPGSGMRIDDNFFYKDGLKIDRTQPGRLPLQPAISVILDPASPPEARRLYASIWEHGVYRSDDGGASWFPVGKALGAPGINVKVCRVVLQPDGALLCLVTGKKGKDGRLMKEGAGLFRLGPGEDVWQNLTAGLDARWPLDFAVDPADSNTIYIGIADDPHRNDREGGLYRSRDGGKTWECAIRLGSRHFGATFSPFAKGRIYMALTQTDANRVMPGYPGFGLWISEDNGESWHPFQDYPFHGAHRVHFDKNAPDTIYVTSFGGGVWKGPALP